ISVLFHVPEARLKEAQGGDLVYSLPPFTSSNASSYRSLLTALDSNLDALQLGGYGISDTTLEEVNSYTPTHKNTAQCSLQRKRQHHHGGKAMIELAQNYHLLSPICFFCVLELTGASTVRGMALAWQQVSAMLIKRFHHSRRDWKGLISQILLPVLFVLFSMGLGSIRNDLRHYPELELSPALYNIGPSYSFFRSVPIAKKIQGNTGKGNTDADKANQGVVTPSMSATFRMNSESNTFLSTLQICDVNSYQPPHRSIPSSQIVYNLSGINVEKYLVSTVWFNPEGHHTMPAYLNSLSNIILRSNLPADKDPRKYGKLDSMQEKKEFQGKSTTLTSEEDPWRIMVAICVLAGFSITTASFAIYVVHEHHSGSKRLQHIAGISEPLYWAVNFFYDMVTVKIKDACVELLLVDSMFEVSCLCHLLRFATFPWMYLLSAVFKDAEMAFIGYVCINLFISTLILPSTHFCILTSSQIIQDIFNRLNHVFLIFPQFNFGNGMVHLARMNVEVQLLSGYGIDAYKNPFSTDVLGWMFISSFIQGTVFFALRLLLNKSIMRSAIPKVSCDDQDEDVVAEHLRVSSGAANSDILQVNQLTKVYQCFKRKVPAVKRMSVGIPAGECFGLLGQNGAGKTTTFKMLTGDVSPTDGAPAALYITNGINIGYCPQVDALDSLLTGEEHLYFYARIRGISKRQIDGVRKSLQTLRCLSNYSCGTRRKLSTALALIGHPQILLLDEPSSGMDPRTKRHLWKIISEEVKGKCAVVLTSHSMEECEALCSRLAIMVKGQFRCLGSLQHIKNRLVTLARPPVQPLLLSPPCLCSLLFFPPCGPLWVADIFDRLESNRIALQIKHFSVSQTTLDEVRQNLKKRKKDRT
uniref:ATP-binding cassette, sub-family A (ABC1), member 12 n=1 Tax=Amphiprion percula TaxID=161767 RepID=A0A3P8T726_AMPPE